jgi:hypothetical protein
MMISELRPNAQNCSRVLDYVDRNQRKRRLGEREPAAPAQDPRMTVAQKSEYGGQVWSDFGQTQKPFSDTSKGGFAVIELNMAH